MEILFAEEFIRLKYPAVDKKSLLQEMVSDLQDKNVVAADEEFFNQIWKRESIMSTGIGRNIAIPHSCHENAFKFVISVWQLAEPIPFGSIDDKPVAIVFLIAVPRDLQDRYMKVLSAISNFVRQPGNIDKLRSVSTKPEMIKLLTQINIKD
ncbi:MAG: PTS sugar transporter subunit IIA [Candidatus Cloacimonetes bacterium]|nr:PTS sugar transporter subunit IIA [Candidatus Cloacimonadota bacterium]